MRDEHEKSKVKGPTRKPDVWATQIRFRIYRLGHPSGEWLLWMRVGQEKSKVKNPTRKTDVWATQIRFRIYRLCHPTRPGARRL